MVGPEAGRGRRPHSVDKAQALAVQRGLRRRQVRPRTQGLAGARRLLHRFRHPQRQLEAERNRHPRRGRKRRGHRVHGRGLHPAGRRQEVREERYVQDSPAGVLCARIPEKLRQEQGRGPHDERMARRPAARGRLLGTPRRLLRQPLRYGLGRTGPDGYRQSQV